MPQQSASLSPRSFQNPTFNTQCTFPVANHTRIISSERSSETAAGGNGSSNAMMHKSPDSVRVASGAVIINRQSLLRRGAQQFHHCFNDLVPQVVKRLQFWL